MNAQGAIQLALEAGRVFTPASPVSDSDLFAGRRQQLDRLAQVVAQVGQHALIFGERGVGKTSLANVFAALLRDQAATLAARVNCDSSDDFASVFRKVFSEIQIKETQQRIGFEAKPEERFTTYADNLPGALTPHLSRRVLEEIARQIGLVVIIDEFDRIGPRHATTFADFIKSLSDHAVPCTLLFVGVGSSVSDLIAGHQSVERALVQVPMPRMSRAELTDILDRGLQRLNLSATPDARSMVADLAQGLPHYAHLLGLHSVRISADLATSVVDERVLLQAVRHAVDDAQQSVRTAYLSATRSPRQDNLFEQVLLSCALAETDDEGYFQPASVRDPMTRIMGRSYDIPGFARHLKNFSEAERGSVLERIGLARRFRFRFRDPLLKPFTVMKGLADGRIDPAFLAALRRKSA